MEEVVEEEMEEVAEEEGAGRECRGTLTIFCAEKLQIRHLRLKRLKRVLKFLKRVRELREVPLSQSIVEPGAKRVLGFKYGYEGLVATV